MENKTARLIPLTFLLCLLVVLPGIFQARATGDFTITANPSNLGRIFGDHNYRVTINITSTGGFSGTVSLSEYDNGGVTASFNPTSVTVSSGGFATSTLTISVSCNFVGGKPPATVQGTSGSLAHDAYVSWGVVIC
jgi:hypothetical protein